LEKYQDRGNGFPIFQHGFQPSLPGLSHLSQSHSLYLFGFKIGPQEDHLKPEVNALPTQAWAGHPFFNVFELLWSQLGLPIYYQLPIFPR
jgi:hypothetical protein